MLDMIYALSSGVVGGLLVAILPKTKDRLRNIVVLIFAIMSAIFTWKVALKVLSGESIKLASGLGGLHWSLNPDPLGAVFALIASTLWIFAAVYSFGYMAGRIKQKTFFTFFLISLSMTLGVAFSGNLIALYIFYEMLTFATYPLVIHDRTSQAMKAGARYIIYSLSGAGAILIAIILTYSWTGGLDLTRTLDFAGGPILAAEGARAGLLWLLLLFIAGFGVKAAMMPLHRWLPAAMVAPTPVSALLHAVAVVYSGAYGILRVIYSVFGHELVAQLKIAQILPWLAALTILPGVIIASRQDVLKRRLAYQTISHISYILLGAFTLTSWGLAGAIMHMISYSSLKMALFFCAGIIAIQTGETTVKRMAGIGRSLPKTMVVFTIAAIGMVGMLPLSTFWGKYYLMKGSVAAGIWPLALVLVISGIINAICFVPIIVNAFRGDRAESTKEKDGRAILMLTPTLVLILISLIIGIFPGIVWPGVEAVVNFFY